MAMFSYSRVVGTGEGATEKGVSESELDKAHLASWLPPISNDL